MEGRSPDPRGIISWQRPRGPGGCKREALQVVWIIGHLRGSASVSLPKQKAEFQDLEAFVEGFEAKRSTQGCALFLPQRWLARIRRAREADEVEGNGKKKARMAGAIFLLAYKNDSGFMAVFTQGKRHSSKFPVPQSQENCSGDGNTGCVCNGRLLSGSDGGGNKSKRCGSCRSRRSGGKSSGDAVPYQSGSFGRSS